MSLLSYNFESQYLKGNHEIEVILPDRPREISPKEFYQSGKKYKVLWLLHGTFGDQTDWVRKTNIERYACERNLVVVMPPALNSNYSNWDHCMMGYSMYDYLIKELMPLIYGWFPVSPNREDNFIAGLSMGGRGAIKYAVNYPERFQSAAILSAVPVDFSLMSSGSPCAFLNPDEPRLRTAIANAGGIEAYINSEENVWRLITENTDKNILPRFLFACGEEDKRLFPNYLVFQAHCQSIGLKADWFSLAGYGHEWSFWDKAIQKALDFFDLPKTGSNPF